MKYVGSKNKLAKELVPIIQSYINSNTDSYIEPFVGGANLIDKIVHHNKIGYDIHEELIELLKYIQIQTNELPTHINEEHYNHVKNNKHIYPKYYQGLVGFTASFSARYFDTYARSFKNDGVTPRDMSNEAIRNIQKQRSSLVDIRFYHSAFDNINIKDIKNSVIYCDIPYRKTEKYYIKNKEEGFDYPLFYDWAVDLSKNNNVVLVSEYSIQDDRFEEIFSKNVKVGNSPTHATHGDRVEKLFKVK